KTDVTGVRANEPRHEAEHRRLARAVRADEPDDPAVFHGERKVLDGLQAAEALREALDGEQAHGRRRKSRARNGYAPCGRNSTTATRSAPYTMRCAPWYPPWPK